MSEFRVDYEIEGVETTMTAIRRGIREGMEKSADDLIGKGKDAAQDRIYSSRRVWTKEVYKYGWGEKDVDTLSPTRVTGRITNYSEHAYVVDEGYDPKWGQPPVQNIIEWVDEKVQGGWTLDGDDGGSGDPPTSQLDTSAVADGDATIAEVTRGMFEDDIEQSINARNIRVVKYDSGERGIFKPNEVQSSSPGVVQNEEVVSRAADLMNWTQDGGFPISRQRTITDTATGSENFGEDVTGNIMAFVEDADEIGNVVKNYHNPDGNIPPEEFGEQHLDWAARVGVLDYIVGNDDRHVGNTLIDPDGNPWAIDSGGHSQPVMNVDGMRRGRLLVLDVWEALDRKHPDHGYIVEDPEKAKAVSNAILDRQLEIFEELRDAETREEFIQIAESLHPTDSLWSGHYEDLLSPDSTWRYRLYDNEAEWGGQELWEADIEEVRSWVDDTYTLRTPDDTDDVDSPGIPWQQQTPDQWKSLTTEEASLTEMMDELFGDLS